LHADACGFVNFAFAAARVSSAELPVFQNRAEGATFNELHHRGSRLVSAFSHV
jgi:hypothetical protein